MEELELLRRFHERYPVLSTLVGSVTVFLLLLLYFYQRKITDPAGAEFIYMDF